MHPSSCTLDHGRAKGGEVYFPTIYSVVASALPKGSRALSNSEQQASSLSFSRTMRRLQAVKLASYPPELTVLVFWLIPR